MSALNWRSGFQRWMNYGDLDQNLRKQLVNLQEDEQTLADCFYKNIEFGTGGMRGELGPGTNRINVYTIRKATEGLSRYLTEYGEKARHGGVVIAYDSRHKSAEFALEAAKVLGKHGIRVFLFEHLCPTPLLSFSVRYLGAFAGIVITASHNPPEYNGYKVYGADGGQITLETAERLMAKINEIEDELTIDFADEQVLKQNGQLILIGNDVRDAYLERLNSLRIQPEMKEQIADQVKIVFTPFHGTSYEPVMLGLKMFGYENVSVVQEQAYPDPNFSHVVSPNPEEHQAFELAIKYGKKENADILMGTDPDGDRLGVAVKNERGEYIVLTGNQIGALLLHYWLSCKHKKGLLPSHGVVLKTIVTSEMGRAIASDFGLITVDTLTGFKYIGEKILEYEQAGEYVFQFGYEESNGYLLLDFVRDKDAVQAALIMADLCAYCKTRGKSIYEQLLLLYEKYGYYCENLFSITLKGPKGKNKMSAILTHFRGREWKEFSGKKIRVLEDYLTSERKDLVTGDITAIPLPKSNMLKYLLEDESWFCIRPSGTESKVKLYFGVKGASLEDSKQKLALLKESVLKQIECL